MRLFKGHISAIAGFAIVLTIFTTGFSGLVNVAGAPAQGDVDRHVLFAVGDIGLDQLPRENDNRYQYDKVAELIYGSNPEAFLMLGDGQHNDGELVDYLSYYDSAFNVLKDVVYPATGNHDYYVSDYAEGYFAYFGDEEYCAHYDLVTMYSDLEGNPLGYYSFDIGSWHIIVLNSHLANLCEFGEDGLPVEGSGARMQYEWLKADLESHPDELYPGTIVTMHHPLYDWELYYRCEWINWFDLLPRQHIWELLCEYDVEMVLSGHNHNYQRWAPQDAYGNYDPDGIREFVVGTGGAYLSKLPNDISLDCAGDYPYGLSADTISNLEFCADEYFGAMELVLTESSCEYTFMTVDGDIVDQGEVICD